VGNPYLDIIRKLETGAARKIPLEKARKLRLLVIADFSKPDGGKSDISDKSPPGPDFGRLNRFCRSGREAARSAN
jgi:hypothetical protein